GLGEAHSAFVTTIMLQRAGVNARFVDLSGWRDEGNVTLDERIEQAMDGIDPHTEMPIVTGYAQCAEGLMREFDRGYSEVTFSKLAALTGAREAIIHKEFHLSSCDPKLVGEHAVKKIGRTNYDVADQLSNMGMEAIHPKAAKTLRQADVPLRVTNAFEPEDPGTLIDDRQAETPAVEIVTGLDIVTLEVFEQDMVGVKGYDTAILEVLTRHNVRIVSKVSNANTITDHLAVLRPHCWIMIGHCGGLRRSQQLGDYVLAHAYIREDHVLDRDLPVWAPVPPIAEVQVALQEAVARVTGLHGADMKTRMRTGTVATTDNRNWELRFDELHERFSQSRAIAVDMESATIAANGFRMRVPYGTLLCVSDKPMHGEIKLPGMANAFYQERIGQHLAIGLEAIRILREGGVQQLHSRKLRSFDEPAFR
ncbi:hypothetical protein LCGC14_2615900, partial [marine sediment metagenome]